MSDKTNRRLNKIQGTITNRFNNRVSPKLGGIVAKDNLKSSSGGSKFICVKCRVSSRRGSCLKCGSIHTISVSHKFRVPKANRPNRWKAFWRDFFIMEVKEIDGGYRYNIYLRKNFRSDLLEISPEDYIRRYHDES